ncbi:MAG: hypothetical protein ABEI52_03385 [Halobacteriaceae archaeon]
MDQETAEFIQDVRDSTSWSRALDALSGGATSATTVMNESEMNTDELRDFLEECLSRDVIERVAEDDLALTERGERIHEYATKDWNPSSPDTKRGRTFEILSDGEWHCLSCEFPSSQPAKDIQMFRKEGFEFVQESGQGYGANRYCENCEDTQFHRKLKYPFPTERSITRQEMPDSFKRRVRDLYDGKDAFDQSSPSMTPEVDHRKPEIRWDESEDLDFENMSDEEIKENFQILSRKNNLLKSRKCEQCVETGERPPFFGVEFYYEGGKEYEDAVGCEGCGWYNPHEWRRQHNELVKTANTG